MRDAKLIENTLFDNDVYDAWQFVVNTDKTIQTAFYCKTTILALITQMEEEHTDWRNELLSQVPSNERRITVTTEDLPQYKVDIAGVEVDSVFLIKKLTKDFFQYVRNVFDSISQIANSSLLASEQENIEKVDFPFMLKIIKREHNSISQDVQDWYLKIEESDEYKYLNAFCNRTKHICDVNLKLSMAFIGGENKAIINPFFKQQEQREKQDLNTYLDEILSFVQKSFDDFMDIIIREIPKKNPVKNRIHKACIYQQKKDLENDCAIVYIKETPTVDMMPDEVEILFVRKDKDGVISCKNCEFDTIYIRKADKDNELVGKYVATETYGDDTLLKYRKYKKIIPDTDNVCLFIEAISEWKKNKKYYHANRFLDVVTDTNDEAFAQRVNLPF